MKKRWLDEVSTLLPRTVTSGVYEGAGIGLALVKEWSERMGAEVSVQSEEGEGTQVILSFAVTDGEGSD